jgi:hypothetical protein
MAVARSGGKLIVNMVNLGRSPQRLVLLRAPLPEEKEEWPQRMVTEAQDILDGRHIEFPLELPPLEPILLEIRAQE